MWYNSTTGSIRGLAILEAWVSSSNMPTATGSAGSGGTVSSSFYATGSTPSATSATSHYNGTGYSAGGNTNNQRNSIMGAGTGVPAALIFGGNPPSTTTETYNGTSWTNGPAYSTDVYAGSGNGTYTAALKCGGFLPAGNPTTSTEEWGGSSWTSSGALPTGFFANGLAGTSAAALAFGGSTNNGPTEVSTSYSYDGSSWTATNSMNTARIHLSGFGSQTAAIGCGGQTDAPASPTQTESWNGTSWSVSPATLASGGQSQAAISNVGTSTAGVVAGGYNPSISNATQEYNSSTNVITAAAWASGETMGQQRSVVGGFGTQTAALMCGGNHPGTTQHANAEQYDGTSFSEQNDMGTARSQLGSCGTLTAGVVFGGDVYPTSPRNSGATEEWNGSSFAEQNDLNTTRRSIGSFGTQTSAVAAAGYVTAAVSNVEEYNGSSWTNVTSLPAAFNASGTAGVETAGLVFGGLNPSNPTTDVTVEYDGSNWTSGGSLITSRWGLNGGPVGTQSDALAFGGRTPGSTYYTNTEGYDGTSWSTRPSLSGADYESGKAGTSTAALGAGGNDGTAAIATSEEFTGETTSANIKTFSTS